MRVCNIAEELEALGSLGPIMQGYDPMGLVAKSLTDWACVPVVLKSFFTDIRSERHCSAPAYSLA